MSALNSRRSLDPRWIVHHRSVPEGWMSVRILAQRAIGVPTWDPETNELTNGNLETIWYGRARVQSNKDWRVRNVQTASDPQQVHYVRVQIPLRKNGIPPHFHSQDIIRVLEPLDPTTQWGELFDEDLTQYTLRVRNAINSSNPWVRNILCAVDLSESSEPRPTDPEA